MRRKSSDTYVCLRFLFFLFSCIFFTGMHRIGRVFFFLVAKRIWWQCFGCLLQYGSPGSGWQHLNAKWRSPRYFILYIYIHIYNTHKHTLYTIYTYIYYIMNVCSFHAHISTDLIAAYVNTYEALIYLFCRLPNDYCVSREETQTKIGRRWWNVKQHAHVIWFYLLCVHNITKYENSPFSRVSIPSF